MKFKKWNGTNKSELKQKIESTYYNDYPTKPIGGSNPYHCCAYCEVSCPEINGNLYKHHSWCEYRKFKESAQ